ncbi:MAG: NAD(P)/FAD-dependent oxidoreductase [Halioglobus sp.]|nr:NAD(P)/FAD-dependent oxidoreductase [Halioglobus sp.]
MRYAEFGLTTQIETDLAESARFFSTARNPTSALPGGEAFPLGTYNGLINALARSLNLQLDTVVSEVQHDASGVTVATSQGEYRGSHVVVTVPLGVLQTGALRFSPPLPASKQAAIDRLGMGSLEKVILRYDSAFWPAPGSGNFLYISPNSGEFPLIVDYTAFAAGSPTVVALYSGDYRRAIVTESDAAIAQRLARVMGEIAGIPAPAPIAAHVTRWKADPFAGGSYSYLAVGATPSDYSELARPVGNRLLFAGEATSMNYNGYVHGAMLTGIREAERLLGREGQGVELLSGLVIALGCDEMA